MALWGADHAGAGDLGDPPDDDDGEDDEVVGRHGRVEGSGVESPCEGARGAREEVWDEVGDHEALMGAGQGGEGDCVRENWKGVGGVEEAEGDAWEVAQEVLMGAPGQVGEAVDGPAGHQVGECLEEF